MLSCHMFLFRAGVPSCINLIEMPSGFLLGSQKNGFVRSEPIVSESGCYLLCIMYIDEFSFFVFWWRLSVQLWGFSRCLQRPHEHQDPAVFVCRILVIIWAFGSLFRT